MATSNSSLHRFRGHPTLPLSRENADLCPPVHEATPTEDSGLRTRCPHRRPSEDEYAKHFPFVAPDRPFDHLVECFNGGSTRRGVACDNHVAAWPTQRRSVARSRFAGNRDGVCLILTVLGSGLAD